MIVLPLARYRPMPTPERNEKVLFQILASFEARQHQTVLALHDRGVVDFRRVGIGEVDAGAGVEPLVLFVVVKRHPVDEAFVLDQTVEARLPVVAEVCAGDVKPRRPPREHANLVAARGEVADGHVLPPSTRTATPVNRLGSVSDRPPGEGYAAEVDSQVRAANGYCGVIDIRGCDDMNTRRQRHGARNYGPGRHRTLQQQGKQPHQHRFLISLPSPVTSHASPTNRERKDLMTVAFHPAGAGIHPDLPMWGYQEGGS